MRRRMRVPSIFWIAATAAAGIRAQSEPAQDGYDRLSRINRASLVMLAETGLVPAPLAAALARGIVEVDSEQSRPTGVDEAAGRRSSAAPSATRRGMIIPRARCR